MVKIYPRIGPKFAIFYSRQPWEEAETGSTLLWEAFGGRLGFWEPFGNSLVLDSVAETILSRLWSEECHFVAGRRHREPILTFLFERAGGQPKEARTRPI